MTGGVPSAGAGAMPPPGAPPPRRPSGNPEKDVGGGLANNFMGRVHLLAFLPRKISAGKKTGCHELFVELVIQADDHSLGKDGVVIEYMKADQLNQWVPSNSDPVWDGANYIYTPAGGVGLDVYQLLHEGRTGWPEIGPDGQPKYEGVNPDGSPKAVMSVLPPDSFRGYTVIPGPQNSRDEFLKGTKWQQFRKELKRIGYDTKAPHINWYDMRYFLVGVYGRWVRVPFKFEGGAPPEDFGKADGQGGQQRGELTTLCLDEIFDLGPISGKTAPGATIAVPAGVPAGVPAPSMAQTLPAAMASAPTAPAPTPAGAGTLGDLEAAVDQIIREAAAAKGATGLLKSEAGVLVHATINAQGKDGAKAFLLVNDNEWLGGDARSFFYIPAKGLIAASEEVARSLAAG